VTRLILAGLFVAAALLIGLEFAKGAADAGEVRLADPCKGRTFTGGGIGGTVQRVVLNGLDGAACELHTSREELVLSLGDKPAFKRRWDKKTIERAVRSGLLRSVDDAERRGEIPGLIAGPIRTLIENAPLDKLIAGDIELSDLLMGSG
jgi:hypothetical protein